MASLVPNKPDAAASSNEQAGQLSRVGESAVGGERDLSVSLGERALLVAQSLAHGMVAEGDDLRLLETEKFLQVAIDARKASQQADYDVVKQRAIQDVLIRLTEATASDSIRALVHARLKEKNLDMPTMLGAAIRHSNNSDTDVALHLCQGYGPEVSYFFKNKALKSMAEEAAVTSMLQLLYTNSFKLGYPCAIPKFYRILSSHPKYLRVEMTGYDLLYRGDGPLPLPWRSYIAIMAASRYNCEYLVHFHRRQFLAHGGDETWLKGAMYVPKKLKRLQSINALLAHRPWLINSDDVKALTEEGSSMYSIKEVLLAICIMSTIHAQSGFVLGMGISLEPEDENSAVSDLLRWNLGDGVSRGDCESLSLKTSPSRNRSKKVHSLDGQESGGGSVTTDFDDAEIFQRLGYDIEKLIEDDDTLEEDVFELVEGAIQIKQERQALSSLAVYCGDDGLEYEDYSISERGMLKSQEFSWSEQCYALLGRYFPELADHLEDQFEFTYEMTYSTFGDKKTEKKTAAFRQAIWYYVHRLVGICNDDYEYREVNLFLTRPIKEYTKTVCCFPETVTAEDFDAFSSSLSVGEKCHVNLLILEARKQASLIYGIKALSTLVGR